MRATAKLTERILPGENTQKEAAQPIQAITNLFKGFATFIGRWCWSNT
jgi:hypothetical protein